VHLSAESESEKAVWKIPSVNVGFQLEIWGRLQPTKETSFYFSLSDGGATDDDLILYGDKRSNRASFEILHGTQTFTIPYITGEDFYVKFYASSTSWTVTVNHHSNTWRYDKLLGYDTLTIGVDDRNTNMVVSAVRVNGEHWGNIFVFMMGN
jgi:hypothetical protein